MKIEITIECETLHEFSSHLIKLRDDLIANVALKKLDWDSTKLPSSINLDDDNCYGSHAIEITN